LALHLELLDERSLAGNHVFTAHDSTYYVSWSNSLARLLGRLGLRPAAEASNPPSLSDVMHDITAHRDGAA
jgi:hypothetical protein